MDGATLQFYTILLKVNELRSRSWSPARWSNFNSENKNMRHLQHNTDQLLNMWGCSIPIFFHGLCCFGSSFPTVESHPIAGAQASRPFHPPSPGSEGLARGEAEGLGARGAGAAVAVGTGPLGSWKIGDVQIFRNHLWQLLMQIAYGKENVGFLGSNWYKSHLLTQCGVLAEAIDQQGCQIVVTHCGRGCRCWYWTMFTLQSDPIGAKRWEDFQSAGARLRPLREFVRACGNDLQNLGVTHHNCLCGWRSWSHFHEDVKFLDLELEIWSWKPLENPTKILRCCTRRKIWEPPSNFTELMLSVFVPNLVYPCFGGFTMPALTVDSERNAVRKQVQCRPTGRQSALQSMRLCCELLRPQQRRFQKKRQRPAGLLEGTVLPAVKLLHVQLGSSKVLFPKEWGFEIWDVHRCSLFLEWFELSDWCFSRNVEQIICSTTTGSHCVGTCDQVEFPCWGHPVFDGVKHVSSCFQSRLVSWNDQIPQLRYDQICELLGILVYIDILYRIISRRFINWIDLGLASPPQKKSGNPSKGSVFSVRPS